MSFTRGPCDGCGKKPKGDAHELLTCGDDDLCADCVYGRSPSFDDVATLEPGIYFARQLNPPGGDDCTHLLVRADGTLGWCDERGESSGSRFTAEELCSSDA